MKDIITRFIEAKRESFPDIDKDVPKGVEEMNFKKGDIIEYCGELFEVEENFGRSGVVWEVYLNYERTGVRCSNFHWEAYGEKCKLIKAAS